jgi:carbon-monoxide dehydrogenase medium subunit
MKFPPFGYHDPETLPDAIALLTTLEGSRLLAGGQSLMPMLAMRYAQPEHLIDLRRIKELAGIRENDTVIEIGAMTRQRDVEYSGIVAQRLPLLREAILHVGHRQTRNRGTVGGSLCHLDPAAEQVSVIAAFDADLVVQGTSVQRRIAASEWPVGFMTPSLGPDEILVSIHIIPWPEAHGWAFMEFARRHGDFAIASAAALVLLDGEGCFSRVSLTIGGIGTGPIRMTEVEQALVGQRGGDDAFSAAAAACAKLEATGDALVPAYYRSHVAGVMAKRALAVAHARATAFRDALN